jgi:hypothetical protein
MKMTNGRPNGSAQINDDRADIVGQFSGRTPPSFQNSWQLGKSAAELVFFDTVSLNTSTVMDLGPRLKPFMPA